MTREQARRLTVVCFLFPAGILALCLGTVLATEGHLWPSLAAFAFVPAAIVAGWFTDPGRPPQQPRHPWPPAPADIERRVAEFNREFSEWEAQQRTKP